MLKDFSQLDGFQIRAAYAALAEYFSLNAAQRDKLVVDPMAPQILFAAHNTHWATAQCLLTDARII